MSKGESQNSLSLSTFSALKWNYAGVLTRSLSAIIINIVLARLLGPEAFGLVAVAMVFIGFGHLVADFGFGAALVQRKEISREDIRYVFTVQFLIGSGLAITVALSAGWIALVFRDPNVVPVVQALAPIFVLQACGQTAASLLKRKLEFKRLQLAQVSSYLVCYLLLGIPLAFLGLGVWSLVVAQLTQSLLYALQVYLLVRHSLKPLLKSRTSAFFRFGSKVVATNLVNWSISNMDNLVVGRFFGVLDLGLYSRAFVLVAQPMTALVSTLQGVLFPAYSRAQDRIEAMRNVYLASFSIVALITIPVFVAVAVVPHTVIEGLYGSRWSGAVYVLVPLALAMPLHALLAVAGPLIWGIGKVEFELRAQILVAICNVLVLLVTAQISLVVLAWGVLGVYLLRFLLMTTIVVRLLNLSFSNIIRVLRGGTILAAPTVAAVWIVDGVLGAVALSALPRLVLIMLTGALFLAGLFAATRRVILEPEVVHLLDSLRPLLPRFLIWLIPIRENEP